MHLERLAYIHSIVVPVLNSCLGKLDHKHPVMQNNEASGDEDKAPSSDKWWGQARVTVSDEYHNQILSDSMEAFASIIKACHTRCWRLLKMVQALPLWC